MSVKLKRTYLRLSEDYDFIIYLHFINYLQNLSKLLEF